ncbi:unnamed protein product [Dracunculus medinensis]|uniref:Innexin n=1 Tax=Dracunculus medinensis TaxID=318479 RepID=A0A0N4UCW0_DRAME|nr:unnamed protein product [Dracunculus medinensis]
MVFSEFLGAISFLHPQFDDDFVDRFHYYYTSTFLILTSVLISIKMFGGRPIECWVPAEYKGGWEDYTEMFCWARNTYWIPFDQEIPDNLETRDTRQVSYYQWTPFFLIISAFFFYLPCLLWRVLYSKSVKRRANINGLSVHLSSILKHRFQFGVNHPYHYRILKLFNLQYYEAYLAVLYIMIKIFYLCNVIGQKNFYGIDVIRDLINGKPWTESGNFPRITLCDLNIRILGNIQRHTVQCVLVINIFTEKA